MKRKNSIRIIILAAVFWLLGGCFLTDRANASSPEQTPASASIPSPAPFPVDLYGNKSQDMERYHLEVWCSGGQLPILFSYRIPLETIAEELYIPTVIIEDRSKEPYLVNYQPYYFSRINVNTYFYELGEDGFYRCEDEQGNSVEKLEGLNPGDYLMNIRVWAMVYDVLYSYDCYLHIIIPGGENTLPWPVITPTPLPVSETVPGHLITSGGDWITPLPGLRTDPGLFQTPTPTPVPMP